MGHLPNGLKSRINGKVDSDLVVIKESKFLMAPKALKIASIDLSILWATELLKCARYANVNGNDTVRTSSAKHEV